MVTRDCEVCGASFEVPYPSTRRRTCKSSKCVKAARPRSDKGSRKSEWVTTPCFGCGNPVERPQWQVRQRQRAYCSAKCRDEFAPKSGDGRPHRVISDRRLSSDGYVMVYLPPARRPTGWRSSHYPEHRQIMRERLGRDLYADENVHHINGVKDDNRPENLELWVRKQPHGQRVADLLAWAHELIDRYEGEAS